MISSAVTPGPACDSWNRRKRSLRNGSLRQQECIAADIAEGEHAVENFDLLHDDYLLVLDAVADPGVTLALFLCLKPISRRGFEQTLPAIAERFFGSSPSGGYLERGIVGPPITLPLGRAFSQPCAIIAGVISEKA